MLMGVKLEINPLRIIAGHYNMGKKNTTTYVIGVERDLRHPQQQTKHKKNE